MCVIVYKPSNTPMPSYDTLSQCWLSNPDGAGFMYPKDGNVVIEKGFMSFVELVDALDYIEDTVDIDAIPFAIHFRIATHGAIKPSCCHPFPVTGNLDRLKSIFEIADVGFMHNGVLHGLRTSDSVSDTMAFDKTVLAPLMKLSTDLIHDKLASQIIENTAQDSRFLLMDGEGSTQTFGRWVEDDGILYSNSSFLPVFSLPDTQTSKFTLDQLAWNV